MERTTTDTSASRPSGAMNPHGLHRLLHPLWFGPVHGVLARELGARPGERVLDVGAGTGGLARRIATSGATVICVEPDGDSLRVTRQRLAGFNAEFVEASAESLPLPSASVGGAVVSVSAHHWGDRDRGFRELARVLRPGGGWSSPSSGRSDASAPDSACSVAGSTTVLLTQPSGRLRSPGPGSATFGW